MTIPDEAVQAMPERIYAVKQTEGSNCVVSFDTPSLDYNVEYVRADLAAPFLQGVKVDSMDTAPKNGDEFLARCGKEWPWFSCFWDGSAFVHYDHTDGIVHYPATEWIPIPKRMLALAPSPRVQALEEAARCVDAKAEEYEEEARDVRNSTDDKRFCQAMAIRLRGSSDAIRTLSSQPVADRLPQDVINLVIAAREAWDTWQLPEEEFKRLDKALEAFASRVPYENEPEALPASPGASE